jgi:sugar lactone lactonase YvrE
MHLMKTNLRNTQGNAGNLDAQSERPGGNLLSKAGGLLLGISVASGMLLASSAKRAEAQTTTAPVTPAYVVYSQTQLASNLGGSRGHFVANSRGDFFVNDGNGHVLEYPANGGDAIILWTDTNNNGPAGVAVDPSDNLYVGNFTYNGPSGNNDSDSLLYEFPSTNQTYPGPYVYNVNSPPGSCNPAVAATSTTAAVLANTGVCAVGLYQGAASYYWQGWVDTAVDVKGTVYTFSAYDNKFGYASLGVFQCQIFCAEQLPGNGASAFTTELSNPLLSIAADYAGDLYMADGANISMVPAGSPTTNNTPTVIDKTYNQPYGVTIDPSGNLYVADQAGIWEVPSVETAGGAPCKGGTDACELLLGSKYKLLPVLPSGTPALYSSYSAPGVDNRGNIVFSPYYGGLYKYSLWQGNFPSAQIGATGSTSTNFTVSFDSATTLAGFAAVQGAAPSTEFTVSPGTCIVGKTFAANSTCTFSATFTPSGLGVRTGDVVITDSTGKSTSTYLTGIGTGTGLAVDPGTPNQIGSGFKTPAGVAVDIAGNVYITDSTANMVSEYPVGGGAPVSIGTGLTVPTGVTVDSGGNVFIVNQGTGSTGGSIVEIPSVAGVPSNAAQTTLVNGLDLPTDIIADGDGNLYITATGSNQVLQMASASRDSASAAMIVRGYGLNAPTGIAIDASGNLYVADTGNNRILQIGDGFQIGVGSGLTAPTGVTVDSSGSVMIADGTGRLIRVPNESFGANAAGLNQADQQVLDSPLSYPYALRVDNTGNLYVTDSTAALVYQLERTTGEVNFGNWNVNTVSDTQSIVFSNIGNADVTIGKPVFPAVPASSEFTATIGTGSSACGSGVFHSGYNCVVDATFAPTATGPATYPLVFSAKAQNTAAPTVNLVGTGVNLAAATLVLAQVAPTTTTISYGQQIIISATVTPTGGSTVTPTGYVVFIFDGQNQRPIMLDGTGAASITFNGLNAGPNTLCAYYEGDANYASLVSPCLPLNIQLATSTNVLTIVGDSANPLSVAPTNSFTLTDTLTPSVVGLFTGTVNFVDLTTGKVLNTNPIRLGSPDPTTGLYVVSIQVLGDTPGLGTPVPSYALGAQVSGNIVAQFSGNTNYFPNTSETVGYTVSIPTYTITQSGTSVTSTASAPGTLNLTITDYSNFQGNVALQCSGLPANAYCVFRPASAQLVPRSGKLPNTQFSPLTIDPVPVTLQVLVDQNILPVEGSVLWIGAVILGFAIFWRRKLTARKLGLAPLVALLCIAGLTALSGCGTSSSSFPTAAGSYAITITGTATPLTSNGDPACSYKNCALPPDPVTNPSINVVKTVSFNLTVK